MKTVLLTPANIHTGTLILVNAQHPLHPIGKLPLAPAMSQYPNILMDRQPAAVLGCLLEDLGCSGSIVPVSGYRSQAEQEQIYRDSLREKGLSFTRRFVALPGCSEHQTGLAIDLGERRKKIDFIRPGFPNAGICGAFRKAAPRYGFVERYPKGKEDITGIAYEPWHFRYLGLPHAQLMTQNGLCLEEYIQLLREYPQDGRRLTFQWEEQKMEIYYVPVPETGASICLPENTVYQISGNNVDGCIVTLWRKGKEASL